jgi:hypothetical protein
MLIAFREIIGIATAGVIPGVSPMSPIRNFYTNISISITKIVVKIGINILVVVNRVLELCKLLFYC